MASLHLGSPPAPPAPPAPIFNSNNNNTVAKSFNEPAKNTFTTCLWAPKELQSSCYKAKVCLYQSPKKCRYRDISGILQNGPTCGLTCISMIMNGRPNADNLLQIGRELKFTNNGEMFSSEYLLRMFEIALNHNRTSGNHANIRYEMYNGELNCEKIKQELLKGACIMVAYPF